MGQGRPFRFGVVVEHAHSADRWVPAARRAEELGYSTLLIRDHFGADFFGDQLAPFAALATAAAATTRLRVGTMVIDNDYRHPAVLAKEAATLDVLSGGRFELGLGAGWLRSEYDQAGIPFEPAGVRVSRLEEAIAVLKGLFADGPCHFEGKHYRVAGLRGFPAPRQRPHPPILVGAGSPRMLRLAGREADIVGILTASTRTGTLVADPSDRVAEAVAAKLAYVREGAGARFDSLELSAVADVTFSDDPRATARQLAEQRGWTALGLDEVLEMPALFVGTADEIAAAMVARRERYGFSYYVVSDRLLEPFAPVVARLAGR